MIFSKKSGVAYGVCPLETPVVQAREKLWEKVIPDGHLLVIDLFFKCPPLTCRYFLQATSSRWFLTATEPRWPPAVPPSSPSSLYLPWPPSSARYSGSGCANCLARATCLRAVPANTLPPIIPGTPPPVPRSAAPDTRRGKHWQNCPGPEISMTAPSPILVFEYNTYITGGFTGRWMVCPPLHICIDLSFIRFIISTQNTLEHSKRERRTYNLDLNAWQNYLTRN